MNTEHISFELLSRYQDGDFFPASEKSRIERHLKSCPICRAELEKIEKMVRLMSALSSYGVSSSVHFQERAMTVIAARKLVGIRENRFFKKHYLPASAVAAIVMAVIGFSVFTTETLHNVSQRMEAQRAGHKNASEVSAVIEAMNKVRNAGGTVVEVSDTYLMVEAPAERIGHIRRALPRSPIEISGYHADRNALAVGSAGTRTVGAPSVVKMKIMVK